MNFLHYLSLGKVVCQGEKIILQLECMLNLQSSIKFTGHEKKWARRSQSIAFIKGRMERRKEGKRESHGEMKNGD